MSRWPAPCACSSACKPKTRSTSLPFLHISIIHTRIHTYVLVPFTPLFFYRIRSYQNYTRSLSGLFDQNTTLAATPRSKKYPSPKSYTLRKTENVTFATIPPR